MDEIKIDKIMTKIENLEKEGSNRDKQISEMKASIFGISGQGGIFRDVTEIKVKQETFSKNMYLAVGALAALQFLIPIILKFINT